MSAVKKTAKASLFIFSSLVLLLVGGAIYLYINMDSLAKQLTEQVASDALGVNVRIGEMDIVLEEKKIVVRNLRIANPKGYENSEAITVDYITIAGESFSKDLLTFSLVSVNGVNIGLEVGQGGTNLSDIKDNIGADSSSSGQKSSGSSKSKADDIKVIVKKFSLTGAQLKPSITLVGADLATVTVPDIKLRGIGERENGIVAEEAIAQIMSAVLKQFNQSASGAGFLEGLSVDILKDMGVSSIGVFKDNLKEVYEKDFDGLKQGIKGLFK